MNKFVQHSKLFFKRNSATILTCVGAAGVVATAILTAKATPKAMALLEEAREEKGDDLTKLEVVKVAAPAYIRPVIIGAATVTCIFGANILNKRQQAAIMSAYALLDRSYKDYREKVEDLYGEEVDAHIKKEVVKGKLTDQEFELAEGEELFYDYFGGRYFTSTKAKVQRAEYNLNRTIVQREYAYLNEFYEDLDLEPLEGGWDMGWSRDMNIDTAWQEWMDFNHEHVVTDDGLECIIVSFYIEPQLDFGGYA